MDRYHPIFEKVKQSIKPDLGVLKEVDSFLKRLNSEIKKNKIDAVAVPGGSVAKGTFLKDDFDVDIFVKFDYDYADKDISKMLEKILKPFRPERVHGSRDYFQIKNKLVYEIVPVLDITDPKTSMNVTDMSPLHVEWVTKYPELHDDIRLAKAFCKAQKVYGAESYIKGFSGHVLDILVIYYSGFMNLLKQSVDWKKKEVIDYYDVYKGAALRKMNFSKIQSPLIIIDPILPDRNAAAALSDEKFEKFREAAKKFIKEPSEEFFIRRKLDLPELKRMKGKNQLVIIEAVELEGKEDIVGAKLMKAFEYIRNNIRENEFKVMDSGWEWDEKAVYWFILKKEILSETVIHLGPPVKAKVNAKMFKDKYPKANVKDCRLYVVLDRKYQKAVDLIGDLIKSDYVKERTKSAKIIHNV